MSKLTDTRLYEATKRLEKRLKEREDEYMIYKPYHVVVGTFNVNNRQPPAHILLQEWLHSVTKSNGLSEEILPDIVAVGFQEIDTSGGAYIFDDKRKENEWQDLVNRTIQACYGNNTKAKAEFFLLKHIRLMGT